MAHRNAALIGSRSVTTPPTTIPRDRTPAARAWLKLISHIIVIAAFNAILAATVYLSQAMSGTNTTINWSVLDWSITAQAVLAVINSLQKYFVASGQPTFSAMLDAAKAEWLKVVPPQPTLPAAALAFQQYANNAFQPAPLADPVTQSIPTSLSSQAPSTPMQRPTWLQDMSSQPPISRTSTTPSPPQGNWPPAGAQLLNTIPNLSSVQNPQG